MAEGLRRLRLVVRRHALPEVRLLFNVSLENDPTISAFLDQVNEIVPLESESWGLEDYVVEIRDQNGAAFECLHFQPVSTIIQADEEVFVRPLFTGDRKKRVLSGRHQISADGKHLIDGVAFGRPRLRTPRDRPSVEIPPLKRRRISYMPQEEGRDDVEPDDDYEPPFLLKENGEEELDEDDADEEEYEEEEDPSIIRVAADFDNIDEDEDADEEQDDVTDASGSSREEEDNDLEMSDAVDQDELEAELNDLRQQNEEIDDVPPPAIRASTRRRNPVTAGEASRRQNAAPSLPARELSSHSSELTILDLDDVIQLRKQFPEASAAECEMAVRAAKRGGPDPVELLESLYENTQASSKKDHRPLPSSDGVFNGFDDSSEDGDAEMNDDDDPVVNNAGQGAEDDEDGDDAENESEDDQVGQEAEAEDDDDDEDKSEEDASDAESNSSLARHYDENGFPPGSVMSGTASIQMVEMMRKAGKQVKAPVHHRFDDGDEEEEADVSPIVNNKEVTDDSDTDTSTSDTDSDSDSDSESSSDEDVADSDGEDSDSDEASDKNSSTSDSDSSTDDESGPEQVTSKPSGSRESSSDDTSSSGGADVDSNKDRGMTSQQNPANGAQSTLSQTALPPISAPLEAPNVVTKPGEGSSATRARNARRRAKKQKKRLFKQANDQAEQEASDQAVMAAKKAELLKTLESATEYETHTETDGNAALASSSTTPLMANPADSIIADAEQPTTEPADPSTADVELPPSSSSQRRTKLDIGAGRRMLFGALGLRAPKTKQDEAKIRADLMKGVRPHINPRLQDESSYKEPNTEPENQMVLDDDPDAWHEKIAYRGVECTEDGVELSEPPFPFVQRWDPQQQLSLDKKRKRGGRNKRRQRNQPDYYDDEPGWTVKRARVGVMEQALGADYLDRSSYEDSTMYDDNAAYEGTNDDIVLDYDDNQAEEELQDVDLDADDKVAAEMSQFTDLDDLPSLPSDLSALPLLKAGEARVGMVITWKHMHLSKATNWQPEVADVTAIVTGLEDDGESLRVVLAKRDRDIDRVEKEYDADGNRVYDKFEAPDMDDDEGEDGAADGYRTLEFASMMVPRILQQPITDTDDKSQSTDAAIDTVEGDDDDGAEDSDKPADETVEDRLSRSNSGGQSTTLDHEDSGNKDEGVGETTIQASVEVSDVPRPTNDNFELAVNEDVEMEIPDSMDPGVNGTGIPDTDDYPIFDMDDNAVSDIDKSASVVPDTNLTEPPAEESSDENPFLDSPSGEAEHEGDGTVVITRTCPESDMESVGSSDSESELVDQSQIEPGLPGEPEVAHHSVVLPSGASDLSSPSRQLDEEMSEALASKRSSLAPLVPEIRQPTPQDSPGQRPGPLQTTAPEPASHEDSSGQDTQSVVPDGPVSDSSAALPVPFHESVEKDSRSGRVEYPVLNIVPSSPGSLRSGRQPDPDFNVSIPNQSFSQRRELAEGNDVDDFLDPAVDEPMEEPTDISGHEISTVLGTTPRPDKVKSNVPTPANVTPIKSPGLVAMPKDTPQSTTSASIDEFPPISSQLFWTANTSRQTQSPAKVSPLKKPSKLELARNREYEEAMRRLDEADDRSDEVEGESVLVGKEKLHRQSPVDSKADVVKKLLEEPIEKSSRLPFKKRKLTQDSVEPFPSFQSPPQPHVVKKEPKVKPEPKVKAEPKVKPEPKVIKPEPKSVKPEPRLLKTEPTFTSSPAASRTRSRVSGTKFVIPKGSQVISLLSDSDSDVVYEEDYAEDSIDETWGKGKRSTPATSTEAKRGSVSSVSSRAASTTNGAAASTSLPGGSGWAPKERGLRGISVPATSAKTDGAKRSVSSVSQGNGSGAAKQGKSRW